MSEVGTHDVTAVARAAQPVVDGLFIRALAHGDVLAHAHPAVTLGCDSICWMGAVRPGVTEVIIRRHVIAVRLSGCIEPAVQSQRRCSGIQRGTAVPGLSTQGVHQRERSLELTATFAWFPIIWSTVVWIAIARFSVTWIAVTGVAISWSTVVWYAITWIPMNRFILNRAAVARVPLTGGTDSAGSQQQCDKQHAHHAGHASEAQHAAEYTAAIVRNEQGMNTGSKDASFFRHCHHGHMSKEASGGIIDWLRHVPLQESFQLDPECQRLLSGQLEAGPGVQERDVGWQL